MKIELIIMLFMLNAKKIFDSGNLKLLNLKSLYYFWVSRVGMHVLNNHIITFYNSNNDTNI
jgi:hypothetical protein